MKPGAISAVPSPTSLRWLLATGVLVAEAAWLSLTFQAPDAALAPEWEALLSVFNDSAHYTAVYTAAIILGPVLLLRVSAGTGHTLSILASA
jgi:hypothetical protein